MRLYRLLAALPLAFVLCCISGGATAEQQGIKVAPAFVTMTLAKDSATKTADIGITNTYTSKIDLKAELKGVEQEQGLLTPTKDLPEQLKNNLKISTTRFSLEPGASTTITLLVSDVASLSPGGNYASLVITQDTSANNTVGLQSAVSVGIFIVKEEGAIKDIQLSDIVLNRFLWNMPHSTDLSFINNGNVTVVPRGKISILTGSTPGGTAIVNQESVPVFPGNQLKLTSTFKNQSFFTLPGKKTIQIAYRFDGSDTVNIATKSFIVVPLWLLFIPIIIILVLYFLIKKLRGKKRHNMSKKVQKSDKKVAPKSIKIEFK